MVYPAATIWFPGRRTSAIVPVESFAWMRVREKEGHLTVSKAHKIYSKRHTHHLIYTEYGSNINTSVDVGRAVEWVKDDTIFSLVFVLDNHCVLELLRDEDGRLPRRAQGIDHDVIRKHVELLLLFTLDICLASKPNAVRVNQHSIHYARNNEGVQIDQPCFADIRRDKLGRELDSSEEEGQIASSVSTKTELRIKDMAGAWRLEITQA